MLIHTIVTHERPNPDEVFVHWMLTHLRPELCEKEVKFQFHRPATAEEGDILDALSREKGYLMVGVGGGEIDEHSTLGHEGKRNDCAATLAAKEWGLADKLELRQLLQYVLGNDRDAQGSFGDIASVMRAMYRRHKDDPMRVIKHAMDSFDALYDEGLEFAAAVAEIKQCGEKVCVQSGGREIIVCVIASDNERCNTASRWLKADVLVQRQASGNTQIHTNKRANLDMADVVRILRVLELRKKGQNVDKDWFDTNWTDLGRDGNHKDVEEWYYLQRGQLVLNGSLTAQKPPTKLSLEDVTWAVKLGLDTAPSQEEVMEFVLDRKL